MKHSLLAYGVVGVVLTGVCCFTPALIFLLGVGWLSAWIGWVDYVLLPTFGGFLALTFYGLYRYVKINRPRGLFPPKPGSL